jgi:hypothetical protein
MQWRLMGEYYSYVTSALDEGGLASRLDHFTPEVMAPFTHWIGERLLIYI